jgi:hypothetical protein
MKKTEMNIDVELFNTEFGVMLSKKSESLPHLCIEITNQYSLHLIKNRNGDNICIANIHLPSGSDVNAVILRLSEIIASMKEIRKEYDFDKIIIGGDVNIPLLKGFKKSFQEDPNQNMEEYHQDIEEVRFSIESLARLLAEHQDVDFNVSLPTEAYIKEREKDNLLSNCQAMAKGGVSSQGTEILIAGHFLNSPKEDNVKIFRGNESYFDNLYSDSFYFTKNPIKFDVLNPEQNFDHQIMMKDIYGVKVAFGNVLETSSTGIKGVAENPYKEAQPSKALQLRWTESVKNIAREAAIHANCLNIDLLDQELIVMNEEEKNIFIDHLLENFYALDDTKTLISLINPNSKQKLEPLKLRGGLDDKMNKKLKGDKKPCEVHRPITHLSQLVACPPFGGFVQGPTYYEKLLELGRIQLTNFIEKLQIDRIDTVRKKVDFFFVTEGIKDDPYFNKEAKEEMRAAFDKALREREGVQFKRWDAFHGKAKPVLQFSPKTEVPSFQTEVDQKEASERILFTTNSVNNPELEACRETNKY